MAWPKLSAMRNRNNRRARTMSQMTARGRSVLRMHDPLFQDANKTVATIFGGYAAFESKRQQKLTARQVMLITKYDTVADPKYLD